MKSKKLLSLVLALVMALSLAVPAFANTNTNTDTSLSQSTVVTGSTQAPSIKITVPATGNVVVNPYKMEVNDPASSSGGKIKDQIVSATQYVVNLSNVPISVSASVAATVAGKAKLLTAPLTGTGAKASTDNGVYLYMQAKKVNDNTSAVTWTDATQVVAAKTAKAADLGITLEQASVSGTTAATTGGYMAYRLAGEAVSEPTTAWTGDDKVDTVTIAFTFTPGTFKSAATLTLDQSTATIDVNTGGSGSDPASVTLTATFAAGDSGRSIKTWAWTVDDNAKADFNGATNTNSVTVDAKAQGSAVVTVTLTLDDDTTLTATCNITVLDTQ